jgi:hypothetical protein
VSAAGSRRRRKPAAARVLIAGVVAAATAFLTPLASADPTPSPSEPALPISVELRGIRPFAPQPGGELRLAGVLRNTSTGVVSQLGVQLLLSHSKLGSRGEFDDYAGTPDGTAPDDAVAVTAAEIRVPRDQLGTGDAESFDITVPVDELQPLESWQVYELALAVTGIPEASPTGVGETVGRLRTFLPYAPVDATGTGVPMRVAWLWPLADRPHRTDDATWFDDLLAPELAADGRLGSLVQAAQAAADQQRPPPREHKNKKRWERRHRDDPPEPPKPPKEPVPVTWVVDPQLVDDATTMADGYRLGTGDDAPEGEGADAAGSWLDSLRSAVAGGVVLPLPYADPDVTSAVRSQLTHEVQVAMTNDRSTSLIDGLGAAQTLDYAWPPNGFIDQRALDALYTGADTVLLDSQALPFLNGTPIETPGARTTVRARDGSPTALLVDHGLSAVVESGATYPTAGPLAVQRLMSELLMIQAELPSHQRSFVLAPERRWDPEPTYAARLLAATGQVPWIEPVTLPTVATSPEDETERSPAVEFPAEERAQLLRRDYLTNVQDLQRNLDAFVDILPPGDAQARSFDMGVLRQLSSAWRAAPVEATSRLTELRNLVDDTMTLVHIASPGSRENLADRDVVTVTLTSHSGTVPITIANELDTPVNVRVGIDSPQLEIRGNGEVTQTIPAHRQVPVDIRATAKTSGVFTLTVTLSTPSGMPYGDPVRLFVRSTAYGRTTLLITGTATAALLVAVAVRLVRRARRARHPQQPEPVDA